MFDRLSQIVERGLDATVAPFENKSSVEVAGDFGYIMIKAIIGTAIIAAVLVLCTKLHILGM